MLRLGKNLNPDTVCPRCGYDLRGVIETWKESCPLEGQCGECGLRFVWEELLSPTRKLPHWCVEYALTGWDVFRRMNLTLQYALWPPIFWSDLKMSHAPRWGRLAMFFLVLVGLFYVLFCLSQALTATMFWMDKPIYLQYGWPTTTNVVEYAVNAAIRPLSRVAPGHVTTPNGVLWSLPSPYDQLAPWVSLADVPVYLLSFALACPLVFLALPHSMRRARVRWAHIARIFVYGTCLVVIPLYLCLLTMAIQKLPPSKVTQLLPGPLRFITNASIILVIPGLMFWWACAIRRYLRMEASVKVWGSVVVIAMLFSLAVVYYTVPHRILDIFEIVLWDSRRAWPWPL